MKKKANNRWNTVVFWEELHFTLSVQHFHSAQLFPESLSSAGCARRTSTVSLSVHPHSSSLCLCVFSLFSVCLRTPPICPSLSFFSLLPFHTSALSGPGVESEERNLRLCEGEDNNRKVSATPCLCVWVCAARLCGCMRVCVCVLCRPWLASQTADVRVKDTFTFQA